MEFGFTEEQEKLRKECHEFFMNELPEDCDSTIAAMGEELQSFWWQLEKKTAAKGYLVPGWSKESGGRGASAIEQAIIYEQWGYWGVSPWPTGPGLSISAPGVQVFGTPEQKAKFLPPVAKGEKVWVQAFTEPEAGSDEANQQTRAVKDGDYYVLNGQKMFVAEIYKPDWLYTLARTADTVPKHRGVTLFLIPADLPGISYRPLLCMGGGTYKSEIFFDDVRVHKDYVLGQVNRGFYHAMSTFEFERGAGTNAPAAGRRVLQEFVQFCLEEKRNGKPLIDDPEVRQAVAQMVINNEVERLITWQRVTTGVGEQQVNVAGVLSKPIARHEAEAMMKIMGLYGQLKKGSKWNKLAGKIAARRLDIERDWLTTRSQHPGGTQEVRKIVLAGRGLGLPRVPASFNKQITEALKQSEARA